MALGWLVGRQYRSFHLTQIWILVSIEWLFLETTIFPSQNVGFDLLLMSVGAIDERTLSQ